MSAPDRLDEAEKAYEVQIESNNAGGSGGQQLAAADPAAEKRVVRKLDYHVVPLLMALCKSLIHMSQRSNRQTDWDYQISSPSWTAPTSGIHISSHVGGMTIS